KKIGLPVDASRNTWVQTERSAHEAWAKLGRANPMASSLMHELVASMGSQNAVVISQKTLAKMMECHVKTVQRAIDHLAADKWIQVVSMGGAGTINAYVVNDQVAWGEKRGNMPTTSTFSARVIADIDDQSEHTLVLSNLRRIPTLYPGEMQLPSGPGGEPPSQPSIPGMEPDLPALTGDAADRAELEEKYGQQRLPG
ncbi:helix-turn-helix domain-containing protein, partial [Massilia sp. P8910]|uniref:helix-turn-helix domain-containing protein n=1 Tax=Massilia antarctica TaxID=2765360 RepID=UPI001E582944